MIVDEEFDDGCCETVVRTGDSYESIVLHGVSKVHFSRSPRKPRQVEIAHQLAAVNSRWNHQTVLNRHEDNNLLNYHRNFASNQWFRKRVILFHNCDNVAYCQSTFNIILADLHKAKFTMRAFIVNVDQILVCYSDYRHLLSTAFRRRRRHSVRSGVPPSLRVSFYRHIRRHGRKTCKQNSPTQDYRYWMTFIETKFVLTCKERI